MKKLGVIILASLLLLSMIGCKSDKETAKGIKVVSTIGVIHDIAKEIGKEHIQAEALMGPGVDPHLYKPVASDIQSLSKAEVILYNGLHLEAKMGDVIGKLLGSKVVAAVAEATPKDKLLASEDYEGLFDPHIWFDVELWVGAVDEVAKALVKADPENKEAYLNNASAYKRKLAKTQKDVLDRIALLSPEKRILVTAHDAFRYFGKAYDFQVKGLQGISTSTEAGTKDVQNLVAYIVDNKIPAIFVESSIPVKTIQAVQAACKAQGWDVAIGGELFADAMGDEGTEEGTYIGMVKHNVNTIVSALLREKNASGY